MMCKVRCLAGTACSACTKVSQAWNLGVCLLLALAAELGDSRLCRVWGCRCNGAAFARSCPWAGLCKPPSAGWTCYQAPELTCSGEYPRTLHVLSGGF